MPATSDTRCLIVGANLPPEIERTLLDLGLTLSRHPVTTLADLERSLSRPGVDLVLVNEGHTEMSVPEWIRVIQRRQTRVPVLAVVARPDEEALVEAMRAGAVDVVSWEHPNRFDAAVKHALQERRLDDWVPAERDWRFRMIMEHLDDVIWLSTPGPGRPLYISPGFQRLWGMPVEDMLEDLSRVNDIVHPDDKPSVQRLMKSHHAEGRAYEIEYRIQPVGREMRWVRERGYPVRDVSGELILMTGVVSDITEMRQIREELEVAYRRQTMWFDKAPVIMVVVDRSGTIQRLNQRAADRLGGTPEDCLGRNFLDTFLPVDQREKHRARFRDNMLGKSPVPSGEELEVVSLGGKTLYLRWSGILLRGSDDKVEGLLAVAEDVTEQRMLRAKLTQTDRLSSMGLLAAGVAHEINNPLTFMVANLEMISEDLDDLAGSDSDPELLSDLHEQLDDVREGVQRIKALNQGLSLFGRVDINHGENWIDLNKVLDVVTVITHNEIKYKAKLVKDYGTLPRLLANDGRLAHAFLSLVLNAAEALEEGLAEENEVRVTTRHEGENVVVTVADTGCGIPVDSLPRVFDPLYSTKVAEGTTGMGLTSARDIVESYGGTLTLTSVPGKGTTVTVTLPAKDVPPSGAEGDAEATAHVRTEPARVLLVDDDPSVRTAVVRMLRQHEVKTMSGGREAMDYLKGNSDVDLVICDMMMPEITGVDFYSWIRNNRPDLVDHLVFVTGGVYTKKIQDFFRAENPPHLPKPFSEPELSAMIARLRR